MEIRHFKKHKHSSKSEEVGDSRSFHQQIIWGTHEKCGFSKNGSAADVDQQNTNFNIPCSLARAWDMFQESTHHLFINFAKCQEIAELVNSLRGELPNETSRIEENWTKTQLPSKVTTMLLEDPVTIGRS